MAFDDISLICTDQSGPVETSTYYLGGRRVAMRTSDEVYWLHGDHLGSTSLVTDESDAVEAATRYLPYGEPRPLNGALPTDYTYTGQRADGTIQLIQVGVRRSPRKPVRR